jgi:hypothetical protein
MVWKLETSGNFNGNQVVPGLKNCAFVGKFERERKLGKSHLEETSRHFLVL